MATSLLSWQLLIGFTSTGTGSGTKPGRPRHSLMRIVSMRFSKDKMMLWSPLKLELDDLLAGTNYCSRHFRLFPATVAVVASSAAVSSAWFEEKNEYLNTGPSANFSKNSLKAAARNAPAKARDRPGDRRQVRRHVPAGA